MTRPLRELPAIVAGVATRVPEVDGNGPPILLLHGFTDSADSWRPLIKELAGHGRCVVAVDLPGSGRAEPLGRPAMPCHDAFVAAWARGYADAEEPLLVGNSLGGLLALRAAAADVPIGGVVANGPAGLGYGWRLRYLAALLHLLHPVLSLGNDIPVRGLFAPDDAWMATGDLFRVDAGGDVWFEGSVSASAQSSDGRVPGPVEVCAG